MNAKFKRVLLTVCSVFVMVAIFVLLSSFCFEKSILGKFEGYSSDNTEKLTIQFRITNKCIVMNESNNNQTRNKYDWKYVSWYEQGEKTEYHQVEIKDGDGLKYAFIISSENVLTDSRFTLSKK